MRSGECLRPLGQAGGRAGGRAGGGVGGGGARLPKDGVGEGAGDAGPLDLLDDGARHEARRQPHAHAHGQQDGLPQRAGERVFGGRGGSPSREWLDGGGGDGGVRCGEGTGGWGEGGQGLGYPLSLLCNPPPPPPRSPSPPVAGRRGGGAVGETALAGAARRLVGPRDGGSCAGPVSAPAGA